MEHTVTDNNSRPLPWWTWVLPLLIFHLGTEISIWSKVTTGSALFYIPVPMALVLVYWWGPRIIPAFYINAMLSAGLWGLEQIELWPLYALPEVIFISLSWLFFIRLLKGKCWLPDINNTVYFLAFGIVVPLAIYKFILEGLFVYFNDIPSEKFLILLVTTGLGDFISIFGLTLPVLYFFSESMTKIAWGNTSKDIPPRLYLIKNKLSAPSRTVEFIIITVLLLVMSRFLIFYDYWFTFGIIALYVAIRWGFGTVIIFNLYILLLTYIIPSISDSEFKKVMILEDEMLKIQLGSGLLYVFSTVTGRVMSDVGAAKKQLRDKNIELEQAYKELDHFVYSVSHDLSAPLKSILGLVNISKLNNNPEEHKMYFSKIESSVVKLNAFIKEVLDYSHNKRIALSTEQIQLKDLCTEILENLKYMESYADLQLDFSGLEQTEIKNDKTRVKMILNNLLTNAMKYQKRIPGHRPYIRISSYGKPNSVVIDIEDNGEGIRPEVQGKVFNMFFRGHEKSVGSGLGLYIAREAAEKINGSISMKSEYGKGSTFSLELKN